MSSTEFWKPNTVVAAIVEREGRFLFVEEMAQGRAVINQPAGHLDPGETLLEACRREAFEETGWHIEPTALVGIYLMAPPDTDITYLRFCFLAKALRHDPASPLDKEILKPLWLSREELVAESGRHRSPLVLRCLDDALAGTSTPLSLIRDLRFDG